MKGMIQAARLLAVVFFGGANFCNYECRAQAVPTASETLKFAAFGAITGTFTGLNSGRNIGITAGADLGFAPVFSLHPSLEVRGTYPIAKGQVDSQKNILGGFKLAKPFGRLDFYGDLLFGRGQINYGSGYANPGRTFEYFQSVSSVISPGIGIDVSLSDRFSFKADGQFQRYASPVTASGHLYSKPLTLGLVYRFVSRRSRQ